MSKQKKEPEQSVREAREDRVSIVPRNPYSKYVPKYTVVFGPSRTKQAFRDECDINKILSRYAQTGQIDHLNNRLAQFVDAPDIDFQSAQNLVVNANQMFEKIPAKIRAKFSHDPGKFLEFALNPANAPQLASMGLIDPVDLPVFTGIENAPQAHIGSPEGTAPPATPVSGSSET